MPRPVAVRPEILAEVERRRLQGEAWKIIANDLRARGEPFSKPTYWRHGVSKRREACDTVRGCATT